jgi:hypothetical protein
MATTENNRRKRIPIILAGSVFTRGLRKPPQAVTVTKSEPRKLIPACPHGHDATEADWHAEGKFYRARKCFKCTFPECMHGQPLSDEDIKYGVKQSSDCPVCFPPYFSNNPKAWGATLSKAGFSEFRGMSMVEEVKPLADGSVKISGYSKNLCTGGGSKEMETADANAELGSEGDVGHKGEADFDESVWVDDLNDPISSKSDAAAHTEAVSNSIGETGPTIKYEIVKIAKGRHRVLENGKVIREYPSRAGAARYVEQVKAEISEEIKHETENREYELQRITKETDGTS